MDTAVTSTSSSSSSKSSTMWEYEAPQYCDFNSADTFADADPNVDEFFFTDHESTKENADDFAIGEGDGSSDTDVFTTPMSVREASGRRKSVLSSATSTLDYLTPKTSATGDAAATPVNLRLSSLRQTPLRDIYNQGGTPMHEAGHGLKVFKSGRKSRKFSLAEGKKSMKKEAKVKPVVKPAVAAAGTPRRETYDMAEITDAIEEIAQVGTVQVSEKEPVVIQNNDELLSEDDDDENKLEQTILVKEVKQQLNIVREPLLSELLSEDEEEQNQESAESKAELTTAPVDFHNITDQELQESVVLAEADKEETITPNTSRRSSYIVKSPSIRVVHFADEVMNNSKLDSICEDGQEAAAAASAGQITPVHRMSESSKKIKSRQATPAVVKPAGAEAAAASQRKTTGSLLESSLRNRLSKKYIKRFSKTMEEKPEGEDVKPEGQEIKPVAGPSTKSVGMSKKRVTIAVPPKATSAASTSGGGNATVIKTKRNMSLKGATNRTTSRRFTTAAAVLARSKSLGSSVQSRVDQSAPNMAATPLNSSKSPYLGLSVLNSKFMSSYCRNYSPLTPIVTKPKVTIPKSPNLLTSQRCTLRKHHTMPNLVDKWQPAASRKASAPQMSQPKVVVTHHNKPFVPTKAITPKFVTESRIKIWHSKHDHDQQDGGASGSGASSSSSHVFKARPVPNFKRLQALSEKRKKEALESGKHSSGGGGGGGGGNNAAAGGTKKMIPFSFEARAHGTANKGKA